MSLPTRLVWPIAVPRWGGPEFNFLAEALRSSSSAVNVLSELWTVWPDGRAAALAKSDERFNMAKIKRPGNDAIDIARDRLRVRFGRGSSGDAPLGLLSYTGQPEQYRKLASLSAAWVEWHRAESQS